MLYLRNQRTDNVQVEIDRPILDRDKWSHETFLDKRRVTIAGEGEEVGKFKIRG